MHDGHQDQNHQDEGREQGDADVVCQEAEHRRHEAGSHIGGGHLDADHGLGFVRPEVSRGGVNDGGINGGAAQTNHNQASQGSKAANGQRHAGDSQEDQSLAQTDHLGVIQLHGQKSAGGSSRCDAHIEQAGKPGGSFRCKPALEHQVAAGPQAGGLFQGTIAEECDHDLLRPGYLHNFPEGERLCLFRLLPAVPLLLLPQGQAEQQNGGEQLWPPVRA